MVDRVMQQDVRYITAGSWNRPESTILSSCSFDSFVSLSKCDWKFSVYQAVNRRVLMESGEAGGWIERARRHGFHEPQSPWPQYARQIQRAFRDFVRTKVAFVQGNGFDNAFGDALLVL